MGTVTMTFAGSILDCTTARCTCAMYLCDLGDIEEIEI
jgi:hypothetical protein